MSVSRYLWSIWPGNHAHKDLLHAVSLPESGPSTSERHLQCTSGISRLVPASSLGLLRILHLCLHRLVIFIKVFEARKEQDYYLVPKLINFTLL